MFFSVMRADASESTSAEGASERSLPMISVAMGVSCAICICAS